MRVLVCVEVVACEVTKPVPHRLRSVAVSVSVSVSFSFFLSLYFSFSPLLPSFSLRYLGNRLDDLQKDFKLRVVLCHVDVPDETRPLQEVTQISFNLRGSLVVVTSLEEAARYIETYVGKRREEKEREGKRREEKGRGGKRRE